jgi:hypothetical protein
MKRSLLSFPSYILLGLLCTVGATAAEQQARARLWCESLRFSQGRNGWDTMDLSTVSGAPNGEFSPYDGKSLISGFVIDYSGLAIYGTMVIGMPPFADADRDGFDDFYASEHAVYSVTYGSYETPVSSGTVTATWNRVADSQDGTCALRLVDAIYGDLGSFSHPFELMEYKGSVFYTPGTTTINCRLMLAQTGVPGELFAGAFKLTKSSVDRFNELTLPPGELTNTTLGALSFAQTTFLRELPWPTNYYAYIDFVDGDLRTGEPDYQYWTISVDDTNDTNMNGIPDFSDDLSIQAPRLAITVGSGDVTLLITGSIGRTHLLQESPSLAPESWTTVATFMLTGSPQAISRPRPQVNAFWRVIAQ